MNQTCNVRLQCERESTRDRHRATELTFDLGMKRYCRSEVFRADSGAGSRGKGREVSFVFASHEMSRKLRWGGGRNGRSRAEQ